MILFFKAIHIVGFVSWFAGLFYLVRMFVYHREAYDKTEPERSILIKQMNTMQWRVYKIICTPAMVITWVCGLAMLHIYGLEWLSANVWMHLKLVLLALLTGYHHYCKRIIKRLEAEELVMTSFQFRLFNEVPTLLLLSIVLLAVYRNTLDFLMAFGGVIGFGVLLFVFAKLYRRSREKKEA